MEAESQAPWLLEQRPRHDPLIESLVKVSLAQQGMTSPPTEIVTKKIGQPFHWDSRGKSPRI
jgi:hypothetical protein